MNEYEPLVHYRHEAVENISPWMWTQTDNGSWEGPVKDWIGDHKPNVLKYCKKFDTVFCVGGNHGLYPRLYSEFFKNVYTFEPDPLNFFCLVHNCQKDNIIAFRAAVGPGHGLCSIRRVSMENTGMHEVVDADDNNNIPIMKIDDFELKNLDLLHIDVEGYEEHVLFGAEQNIIKHKPLILVERGRKASIVQFLMRLGYTDLGNSSADIIYST